MALRITKVSPPNSHFETMNLAVIVTEQRSYDQIPATQIRACCSYFIFLFIW